MVSERPNQRQGEGARAGLRPLALLSNDDGYSAEGLRILAEELSVSCDVVICAPLVEQSATSHSLSLNRPLRVTEHAPGVFSVDGTPADSVYVALHGERVLPRPPDVVVSGLNRGPNLGQDVFYSGTVAAAREGALHGYPAIAFSAAVGADLRAAARYASELVAALSGAEQARVGLFNVNFPHAGSWLLTATRLGKREYEGGLVERHDPRGVPYYWIGGSEVRNAQLPGSDTEAFDAGAVGLTPLVLDLWSSHLEDDAERIVSAVAEARKSL